LGLRRLGLSRLGLSRLIRCAAPLVAAVLTFVAAVVAAFHARGLGRGRPQCRGYGYSCAGGGSE